MKVVVFKKKDCSLFEYRKNVDKLIETKSEYQIHYDSKVLFLRKDAFYIMVSTN